MSKITKTLSELVMEALDLGFACVSDGDHAPFVLLLDVSGEWHTVKLESPTGVIDGKLVADGRDLIREFKEEGQVYALVWDGYLTLEGEKQDAVFVEAGKRGDTTALVFAQKYKRAKRSNKTSKDGGPLFLADADHLWKPGPKAKAKTSAKRSKPPKKK